MSVVLPTTPLGATDIHVSRLGLGTVKLGRNQGVKYPSGFKLPSDNEASHLLALAHDCGINLIDTAPAYGLSEERLGKLLKGQRDKWVICTKAGEEFHNGQSHYDFSPEHIRKSVERSLKRLQTDWLDMVLIHSDGNDGDIIENGALETLSELKQEGLIRATGMSTKTVNGGIAAAQHSDCVMATYNLDEQTEEPVLDYCLQHNKGVLLKKVLASGHMVAGDSTTDRLEKSMQFVFSHPGVTSAIIGTLNPKHLQQNVEAAVSSLQSTVDSQQ